MRNTYLRFVKWEGDNACFKKASISDLLLEGLGAYSLARWLEMKDATIILKMSKGDKRFIDRLREKRNITLNNLNETKVIINDNNK
jgi:hypothetical protein